MKTEDYTEFVPQVDGYLNFKDDEKTIKSYDLENMLAMCSPGLSVKQARLLTRKLMWVIAYLVVIKNRKISIPFVGRIEMVKSRTDTARFPAMKHRHTYTQEVKPFKKKYGKE